MCYPIKIKHGGVCSPLEDRREESGFEFRERFFLPNIMLLPSYVPETYVSLPLPASGAASAPRTSRTWSCCCGRAGCRDAGCGHTVASSSAPWARTTRHTRSSAGRATPCVAARPLAIAPCRECRVVCWRRCCRLAPRRPTDIDPTSCVSLGQGCSGLQHRLLVYALVIMLCNSFTHHKSLTFN